MFFKQTQNLSIQNDRMLLSDYAISFLKAASTQCEKNRLGHMVNSESSIILKIFEKNYTFYAK